MFHWFADPTPEVRLGEGFKENRLRLLVSNCHLLGIVVDGRRARAILSDDARQATPEANKSSEHLLLANDRSCAILLLSCRRIDHLEVDAACHPNTGKASRLLWLAALLVADGAQQRLVEPIAAWQRFWKDDTAADSTHELIAVVQAANDDAAQVDRLNEEAEEGT